MGENMYKKLVDCVEYLVSQMCNKTAKDIKPELLSWKGDEQTTETLNKLKQVGQMISNSATKISMLEMSCKNDVSVFDSIFSEVLEQVEAFAGYHAVAQTCHITEALSEIIMKAVKEELHQFGSLLKGLEKLFVRSDSCEALFASKEEEEEFDAGIRSLTGMVWNVNDNIIQKLAISNRTAYRREYFEGLAIVKDTIVEFNEYIQEAEDASVGASDDSTGDAMLENMKKLGLDEVTEEEYKSMHDMAMEGLESVPYTTEEVAVVKTCVAIMSFAEQLMKFCLTYLTHVNDKLDGGEVPDTVLTTITDQIKNKNEQAKVMRKMTYDISMNLLSLPHELGELGLELFVPFDSEIIQAKKEVIINHMMNEKCLQMIKQIHDIYCLEKGEVVDQTYDNLWVQFDTLNSELVRLK